MLFPKPKAIVVDLDGTLAIPGNRDIYDGKLCCRDGLNQPVSILVQNMKMGGWSVIVLTGRNWGSERECNTWLRINGIYYDELLMRDPADWTPSADYKRTVYENSIRGQYDVLFALDDDPSVVRMWREIGVPAFQVADYAVVDHEGAK